MFPRFRHMNVEGDLGQMAPQRRQLAEYLLARLPGAETDAVTDQLFSDERLLAEMEDVERDLFDAYARGRLSKLEALSLETGAMNSEERTERLRFALALARARKSKGLVRY